MNSDSQEVDYFFFTESMKSSQRSSSDLPERLPQSAKSGVCEVSTITSNAHLSFYFGECLDGKLQVFA